MRCLIFDIEANGYNELVKRGSKWFKEADRIHVLAIREYGSKRTQVFRHNDKENTIAKGWALLQTADAVVGHNIIAYDWPILERVCGEAKRRPKLFDTLVGARLLWPDAQDAKTNNDLDALARRAGHKGKTPFEGPWTEWSQKMEDYCVDDVDASLAVFKWIKPKLQPFKLAFRMETKVAEIIARQTDNGVRIDTEGAERLIERLEMVRAGCLDKLRQAFPPRIEVMKSRWVVADNGDLYPTIKAAKEAGWHRDNLCPNGPHKTKEHPFECTSKQLAERFKEKYDWDAPTTDAGNPSLKEEVLMALDFEEAEWAWQYNMAGKRLEHLADWIERAQRSRTPGIIHPSINTCGAATSRMTHKQPNQTAAPKVKTDKTTGKPKLEWEGRWGYEMRSLWGPTRKGWVQWGADASGLEFRMLANRMWRWDKGAYAKVVVEGDVHMHHKEVVDGDTKEQIKESGYAFIYGGGDEKVGGTYGAHKSLSPAQRRKYAADMRTEKGRKRWGRRFKQALRKGLPALDRLIQWIMQAASQHGFLPLLDGRHAPIRKEYAALNTQLQGDGAVVMKLALCLCVWKLKEEGLKWGKDYALMLNAHDEFQGEARNKGVAERCGRAAVWAIEEAGKRLKCRVPLTGEYKIGPNWAATH